MTGSDSYGTLLKGWFMDFLFETDADEEVVEEEFV